MSTTTLYGGAQGSIGCQVTDSRVDLRERYAQLHTSRVMDYSYLNTLN